jgi:hypothetical protein
VDVLRPDPFTGPYTGFEYRLRRLTKVDLWDRPACWPIFQATVERALRERLSLTTLSAAERLYMKGEVERLEKERETLSEDLVGNEMTLLTRGVESAKLNGEWVPVWDEREPVANGDGVLLTSDIPEPEKAILLERIFHYASGMDYLARREAAIKAAGFCEEPGKSDDPTIGEGDVEAAVGDTRDR